jgi:hypothetical protein
LNPDRDLLFGGHVNALRPPGIGVFFFAAASLEIGEGNDGQAYKDPDGPSPRSHNFSLNKRIKMYIAGL